MQVRPLLITLIPPKCLRISRMEGQGALLVQVHRLFSEPEELSPRAYARQSSGMWVRHSRASVQLSQTPSRAPIPRKRKGSKQHLCSGIPAWVLLCWAQMSATASSRNFLRGNFGPMQAAVRGAGAPHHSKGSSQPLLTPSKWWRVKVLPAG